MRAIALTVLCSLIAPAATAFTLPDDELQAQFIRSNVVATFYHEIGHGLINVLDLSVLGREEDAADSLSAVMIHNLWQEEAASQMVYDVASAFLVYDSEAQQGGAEIAYWDEHSLDMQRYYNLICLYYGADPNAREADAIEMGLPEDRAMRCPDEFELADASWATTLDSLTPGKDAKGLRLVNTDPEDAVALMLADEIATLNAAYALPDWIDVQVADCGQANAFYDPSNKTITICTEYAEDLDRLWLSYQAE
jgi:Putative metallopeptidase